MNDIPSPEQLLSLRNYFDSGVTRPYAFRRQQLQKLKAAILQHEEALYAALHADLKKSPEESWVTETGFLIGSLNRTLKGLREWMQPERVPTNLVNFPSSSYILRDPLGVVLIIGPWNYPIQLLFTPLIGAIAAGNCVVLKASEFAPATAAIMRRIISETFSPNYILYTEGDGAKVVPGMMNHFRFDHVFYTGSTSTGKIIYRMAAEQLIPVTLELGGKSPAVVESDANIAVAAKRITMTKFSNAGQMCIAPDYVLVHTSQKEKLVKAVTENIKSFYTGPEGGYSYGKIINEKQFNRLIAYLKQGTIIHGGKHDASKLFIEPTIMENVPAGASLMKDEIFGPILPIIPFNTLEEARKIILNNPEPLSFYIYTSDRRKEKAWLESVAFGGGCVNNSSWHFTNHSLPFGGRGNSGLGQYHGRASFDVFTHRKAIMKTPTWFDPAMKYPPFLGKLKLFRWLVR
jgi:aldehyde dehydrogenase (NAD+)